MTLDEIEPGKHASIVEVDWSSLADDEGKRLRALGLDSGADVMVVHRGVFGGRDPLAIVVGRMTIAVRRVHARAMHVTMSG
ncbi:MAG: ferrous iron transport protein A [Sphingomonadaceae bacterium]